MNGKSHKSLLKIFEKKTYAWTLYYLEIKDRLRNDGFTETFPEKEEKWKGKLCIHSVDDVYVAKLWLNAGENNHIKYSFLLLDSEKEIVEEIHGEITTCKEKKLKDLKCCSRLEIDDGMFVDNSDFIQIKVIIRENATKIPNAVCGTDTSQEIRKRNYETEILQEINVNESLKNDLKMMFENKEFTDFVIKLSDSSEIPVHRSILAARSSVFSAMLRNDSAEKNEGYVNVTDIDKDTMILLLNFIYTGNIVPAISVEGAKNLLYAADKYDILHLKRICGKYLESNLEISNAIDILILSQKYNVPELKNSVFELIINKKKSFKNPVMFEKVEKQFPELMTELVMEVFGSKT